MKAKEAIIFLLGTAMGVLLMGLFSWEQSGSAEPELPRRPQEFSTSPESRVAESTPARAWPSDATRPETVSPTREATWIDRLQGITPADMKARAQREVNRVTLARIQRHLITAPVAQESLGKLMDLLTYKMNFTYEFGRKSKMLGLGANGDEFDRRRAIEERQLDNEIRSLVGQAYFDEMMQNGKGTGDRLYNLELIGGALSEGQPLTIEQREKLNEIVTRLGSASNEPADPQDGLTMYDRRVLKELEGVVSPDQLSLFREIQADRNLFRLARRLDAKDSKQ